jgi:hypothetical protein
MRYYDITVTRTTPATTTTTSTPGSGPGESAESDLGTTQTTVTTPGSTTTVKHWTSHPNGLLQPPDPGALKVEIDVFNVGQGTPLPGSFVRIWGISLDDIGRASDLNGCDLVLRGGMGKGLPLANPNQAGILIEGHVQQAFANWVGTTMTLDLLLVAGTISSGTGAAVNAAVHWPPNTPMSTMLQNLLLQLFPGGTFLINISQNLVLPYLEKHFAGTLQQLGQYLTDISRRIVNTGPAGQGAWNTPNNSQSAYPGVQMVVEGSTVRVVDGTVASTPKTIVISDLVGQPTWIAPSTIQVNLVMRGDLHVGDFITLPPTRAIVTAASQSQQSQQRQDIIFQGTFMITKIHDVGNYKDPGPLSWVTVVDAFILVNSNANGTASLNDGTSSGQPNQNQPSGQLNSTDAAAVNQQAATAATGATVGLQGGGAASNAFSSQPPAMSGTLDSPDTTPASASSVGLVQSAPAPSQVQSVQPAQPNVLTPGFN